MPHQLFYDGETRFTKRIIRRWNYSGFNFNEGHLQLLKYAWRARLYWGNIRREKVSEANRVIINGRLF